MSTATYIVLSLAEAVLLVVVLAVALVRIRQRLDGIGAGLATVASLLGSVERDVRPLGDVVPTINGPLSAIAGALPGIAAKAKTLAGR